MIHKQETGVTVLNSRALKLKADASAVGNHMTNQQIINTYISYQVIKEIHAIHILCVSWNLIDIFISNFSYVFVLVFMYSYYSSWPHLRRPIMNECFHTFLWHYLKGVIKKLPLKNVTPLLSLVNSLNLLEYKILFYLIPTQMRKEGY